MVSQREHEQNLTNHNDLGVSGEDRELTEQLELAVEEAKEEEEELGEQLEITVKTEEEELAEQLELGGKGESRGGIGRTTGVNGEKGENRGRENSRRTGVGGGKDGRGSVHKTTAVSKGRWVSGGQRSHLLNTTRRKKLLKMLWRKRDFFTAMSHPNLTASAVLLLCRCLLFLLSSLCWPWQFINLLCHY